MARFPLCHVCLLQDNYTSTHLYAMIDTSTEFCMLALLFKYLQVAHTSRTDASRMPWLPESYVIPDV